MGTKENPAAANSGVEETNNGRVDDTHRLSGRTTPQSTLHIDDFAGSEVVNCNTEGRPDEIVNGQGSTAPIICQAHANELAASAIDPRAIREHGIYTAYTRDQLPEHARYLAEHGTTLPALVFPKKDVDGTLSWQVKPAPSKDVGKYISPAKHTGLRSSQLWAVRSAEGTDRIVIVEGTKQALAAASHAPVSWTVLSIQGIQGWSKDGVPTPQLAITSGCQVVIIPDADAATNPKVYGAAAKLGEACKARGASQVAFAHLAAEGTAGVDDVLAAEADDAARHAYLSDMLTRALTDKGCAKPAKVKPTRRSAAVESDPTDTRPKIVVSKRDPCEVLTDLCAAVHDRVGGVRLYRQGDTGLRWITRPDGSHVRLRDVDQDVMMNIIAESAQTFIMRGTKDGPERDPGFPPAQVVKAVVARVSTGLPELTGVTHTPVVRPDGTLAPHEGFDEATGLYLDISDDLRGIEIPMTPTDAEVAAARTILVDDLLGDFMLKEAADVAAALGAILTPIIRPMVPTAPVHVLNGNHPGVGKGLLIDVISLIFFGETANVGRLPAGGTTETSDDTELRKSITSSLIAGETLIVYDEATTVGGYPSLNALVTAERWIDRKLGVSERMALKNSASVLVAGNNVEISADMARRTVQVRLYTEDAHPEDRPASSFKHPELKGWVREHRREILGAVLTLVQAWVSRNRPKAADQRTMGSFEAWSKTVGGILSVAGVKGHLSNLDEQRVAADWVSQRAVAHLEWLTDTFGADQWVTARQIVDAARTDPDHQLPDGVDKDMSPVKLAYALRRLTDRWYDVYRLHAGKKGRGGVQYRVEVHGDPGDGGNGTGPGPTLDGPIQAPTQKPTETSNTPGILSPPTGVANEVGREMPTVTDVDGDRRANSRTVFLDLETCVAGDLYKTPLGEFVRLAGYAVDGGPVTVTTDMGTVCQAIESADRVVGHNAVSFDLAALAHHHGLDVDRLIEEGRVRDTLLMARQCDPPNSGNGGRKYTLDAVGNRLVNEGKSATGGESDLKRLARQYGGYDKIPTDDPVYRAYLVQDVELLRSIYGALACDEYTIREHRVMWALRPVSQIGLRLDVEATQSNITEAELKASEARQRLADTRGLPGDRKSPQSTSAGQAALQAAFDQLAVEPVLTKAGKISVTKDVLEKLRDRHATNRALFALVDDLVTLVGTRTVPQTLLANVGPDGHVHPGVSAGQSTGRLSLTKPGLTVMGKRDRSNALERALLLPDADDERLISVDLSQIDARAVAALCGDPAYLAMYEPGKDAHTALAVTLWGDPGRRSDAKAVGHASNYGMGPGKLAAMTGKSISEAEAYQAKLSQSFPGLEQWKTVTREVAERGGLLRLVSGRWVRVKPDKAWTGGPASLGQGTARDLLTEGILRLPTWLKPRLRAVIHDEVILSVPADRAEEAQQEVLEAMQFTFSPEGGGTVEVLADSGDIGRDWADVYASEHEEWPEMSWKYRNQ